MLRLFILVVFGTTVNVSPYVVILFLTNSLYSCVILISINIYYVVFLLLKYAVLLPGLYNITVIFSLALLHMSFWKSYCLFIKHILSSNIFRLPKQHILNLCLYQSWSSIFNIIVQRAITQFPIANPSPFTIKSI